MLCGGAWLSELLVTNENSLFGNLGDFGRGDNRLSYLKVIEYAIVHRH